MITKTKRYGFIFSEETDGLIKKLAKETGMKYSTLVEKALQLLAEKKGVK
jgi:hypothetical protein